MRRDSHTMHKHLLSFFLPLSHFLRACKAIYILDIELSEWILMLNPRTENPFQGHCGTEKHLYIGNGDEFFFCDKCTFSYFKE